MDRYIQSIHTTIPYTDRIVNIDLRGRNLILTGGNGCGKTNFINHLYQYLVKRIVERDNATRESIDVNIRSWRAAVEREGTTHPSYQDWINSIRHAEQKIFEVDNPVLTLNTLDKFVEKYHSQRALLTSFKAVREANISESNSASSTSALAEKIVKNRQQASTLFEQYLVSYKTVQAYAEAQNIDNKPELASKIQTWFRDLEANLRFLFEDPTLTLQFDSTHHAFLIKQNQKEAYRFQQLSSGYSSILAVYADLITTVQLTEVTPNEIEGVVFVDEIDAHLHVSLQRKIFSFLDRSFPNVQFIVTTHSPFVVSSVSDAVIYDLSRLEQIDDLSMYSYESILEGLFGVSVNSDLLNAKTKELCDEANKYDVDIDKLEKLISELRQFETKLDSESLMFLESAQVSLLKAKIGKSDV